jgi:uncharacterized membrane protein
MRKMIYRAGTGSVAAIKGHPLHPMLVPVVIGAFIAAVIADLMYFAQPDPFWAQVAAWLLLLTLVAGIVAAVPGLIDLVFVRRARALPVAWAHGMGNVVFISLTAVNYFMRVPESGAAVDSGMRELGVSLISLLLIAITGWLGGEMSYRHGIGVSRRVGAHQGSGGGDGTEGVEPAENGFDDVVGDRRYAGARRFTPGAESRPRPMA